MEEQTSTPNPKTLISELIRGKECTKRLQNLLHWRDVDGEPESPEDLVMKIIGSFSNGLSMFSSWGAGEICLAPTTTNVGPASSDDQIWKSGERGKKMAPAMKDRRGYYKRRESKGSKVKIAETYEDGYAWRKYGQKEIQHAKFPRCYYRCTHKDEGCKAIKHVQELDDGSKRFHITYFGSHTCQDMNTNAQMFPDSEDPSFSLINFESSGIKRSPSSLPTIINVQTTPLLKQENNSNAQNGDYLASSSHNTSANYVWEDMLGNLDISSDDTYNDDIFMNDFKFY